MKRLKTFENFTNEKEKDIVIPKKIENLMRMAQFSINKTFHSVDKLDAPRRKEIWKFIDANIDQKDIIEAKWRNFYKDQTDRKSKYKK